LNGENGSRVFRLAEATGVPITIHLEPEDAPLDALQEMLASHPKAPVIVAHFGQIRHPARQKRFGPDLARQLLTINPNLYYDLSTGDPGRQYHCSGVFDTVIWEDGSFGQTDNLKPEYKAILSEFSDRFVVGTDYGGGRGPLPAFLKKKVANIRLILRDLAGEAKHDIGYRNAWKLLTGKDWRPAGRGGR
jgi:predicted TIM-barrel fold metal-dependent hydrolase